MSRSSRSERLLLALGPHAVTLQRLRHGWLPGQAPRLLQQWQAQPVNAVSTHETTPAAPWQAALQAASGLLGEAGAGHELSVQLSNHWLRYRLLPAMPPMLAQAQALQVAQQAMLEHYGDSAQDWTLRLAPLPYGDSQLCCALDQALLQGLHTTAQAHGLPLRSLQPTLMHGFNRIHRRLGRGAAALAQVEPGRVSLALFGAGSWLGLQASPAGSDWQQALLALLQRDRLLSGSDAPATGELYLQLLSPLPGEAALAPLQAQLAGMGWRLVVLPPEAVPLSPLTLQPVAELG